MLLRTCVGIAVIVVAIAACKKPASDGAAGSSAASGSAAISGGDSGPWAGSAAAGSGSGAAAAAGSAASGSGSGSAAGAAPAGYDKAAFLADPLCAEVADQIRGCADQPEFIVALDDGAAAPQKKINARLRKGIKKWQTSHELCSNAWDIINYEYTGFLDNPAPLKAPGALASCAALGAAVKAAGGLVGGGTAE